MNKYLTIDQFLLSKTPQAWLDQAVNEQAVLLIDHANCEKKAAATALHLMHRYVEYPELLDKMSKLAREELLHFEKVISLMAKRGVKYIHLSASRYAEGLTKHVRKQEPYRLIDRLIIGALIEARSCERFHALAPYMDDELQKFYASLFAAEQRHFQDYLQLADSYSEQSIDDRVRTFADIESELIQTPDPVFRFHSGLPES